MNKLACAFFLADDQRRVRYGTIINPFRNPFISGELPLSAASRCFFFYSNRVFGIDSFMGPKGFICSNRCLKHQIAYHFQLQSSVFFLQMVVNYRRPLWKCYSQAGRRFQIHVGAQDMNDVRVHLPSALNPEESTVVVKLLKGRIENDL